MPTSMYPDTDMAALSRAERLAVWTMRRIACGPQTEAMPAAELWWGERADMAQVAAAMRGALRCLHRSEITLTFACSGSETLTAAERCLLIAVQAAQIGDDIGTERVLQTMLPGRAAVRPLAAALGMLAAALASDGEWLPPGQHPYVLLRRLMGSPASFGARPRPSRQERLHSTGARSEQVQRSC